MTGTARYSFESVPHGLINKKIDGAENILLSIDFSHQYTNILYIY